MNKKAADRTTSIGQYREVRFSERIGTTYRPSTTIRLSRERLLDKQPTGRSPGQLSNKKSSMSKIRELNRSIKMHYSGVVMDPQQRSAQLKRRRELGNSKVSNQEKSQEKATKAGESDSNLMESRLRFGEQSHELTERIQNRMTENHDQEIDELRHQLRRKQEEIDSLKKLHAQQQKRFTQELEKANHDRKQLDSLRRDMETRQVELSTAVSRLQREIIYYQSQVGRNAVSVTEGVIQDKHNGGLPSVEEYRRMRESLDRMENKLRNSQRYAVQCEAMVCDLHLQRRFLREQLQLNGVTRQAEFQRAEQKMLRSQAHRKNLL